MFYVYEYARNSDGEYIGYKMTETENPEDIISVYEKTDSTIFHVNVIKDGKTVYAK